MKRKGVKITDDQHEWLKENKQINFSGLVRKFLNKYIDDYESKDGE